MTLLLWLGAGISALLLVYLFVVLLLPERFQ
ncbi:MAG: K(+)-transporting ATPase subunit F [Myxococcales bacterium]|nr:K(+)-transporting ATPase subunit F [Myxococcales bacterium]